jgi:hypothetical protein
MTKADKDYIRGFNDAVDGKDCKASSHDYLDGFRRGREISRNWNTNRKA